MARETKTYTLTSGSDDTQALKRFGGLNSLNVDVTSATGAFELIVQASVDGTEYNDKYNSGTVSDLDDISVDIGVNEISVRIKVTDKSAAGNVVVVYATPFVASASAEFTDTWAGLESHFALFTGDVWYVDAGVASSGDGTNPQVAFKTIGEAITATSAGDAITVKAGTYTETGLDLDEDATELWFEIGTIIDPVSGTALTISGDYCRVKGTHKITPAGGAIGLSITGVDCCVSDGKILEGATGVQVTGTGVIIHDYAVGFPTTTAFDLQGARGRLKNCKTVGNAATTGYKISNSADTGVLENCTSAGHTTSGYSISTGSQDWTIFNCSSGAGDGKWVDTDDSNVWSNFSFDDEAHFDKTFTGGAGNANMFKITGSVKITELYGYVSTVLAGDVGNIYLQLWDTANTIDITDAPGVDVSSAPEGSYIHKVDDATVALEYADASQVRFYEDATKFGEDPHFQITARFGVDTFLRLVWSGNAASGAIHWHVKWQPLPETGFLEGV